MLKLDNWFRQIFMFKMGILQWPSLESFWNWARLYSSWIRQAYQNMIAPQLACVDYWGAIIFWSDFKCKEDASDDNAYSGIPINFRSLIQTQKGAIIIHDCIYQFLRIFYHSRFKPQQLEMTATQLLAPFLDFILTLPLVIRLFQEFSRFSNAARMTVQSKPEING